MIKLSGRKKKSTEQYYWLVKCKQALWKPRQVRCSPLFVPRDRLHVWGIRRNALTGIAKIIFIFSKSLYGKKKKKKQQQTIMSFSYQMKKLRQNLHGTFQYLGLFFSDVLLVCGHQESKLHVFILCIQSSLFFFAGFFFSLTLSFCFFHFFTHTSTHVPMLCLATVKHWARGQGNDWKM